MPDYIYVYDCKNAREYNATRVKFTKALFGYEYRYKTKAGYKTGHHNGLIDECPGANTLADSTVFVPDEYKEKFDGFFSQYSGILKIVVFEVLNITHGV